MKSKVLFHGINCVMGDNVIFPFHLTVVLQIWAELKEKHQEQMKLPRVSNLQAHLQKNNETRKLLLLGVWHKTLAFKPLVCKRSGKPWDSRLIQAGRGFSSQLLNLVLN